MTLYKYQKNGRHACHTKELFVLKHTGSQGKTGSNLLMQNIWEGWSHFQTYPFAICQSIYFPPCAAVTAALPLIFSVTFCFDHLMSNISPKEMQTHLLPFLLSSLFPETFFPESVVMFYRSLMGMWFTPSEPQFPHVQNEAKTLLNPEGLLGDTELDFSMCTKYLALNRWPTNVIIFLLLTRCHIGKDQLLDNKNSNN